MDTRQQIAALLRALPDTALCAVADALTWADAEGHLPDLASTEEDHDAILRFLRFLREAAAIEADGLAHDK